MISQLTRNRSGTQTLARNTLRVFASLLLLTGSSVALAQDVRWSYFEVSYIEQDIDQQGTMVDFVLNQSVDIDTSSGNGIKFKASLGTWHNLFAFIDFTSSDIDVDVVVTNSGGVFPASDEFDYTTYRSGIGAKWSITHSTDVYGAVTYDSTDFDFGSFAGESFDTDAKDAGAALGIRHMLGDNWEIRASGRYSNHAAVDLNTLEFDSGAFFGVGFSWEIVRGLALIGDYETGDVDSWAIGFRLDMDED